MDVTIEEYLAGLTGEQMRGLALKVWADAGGKATGNKMLERYRAGQLHMQFEEIVRQQSAQPPPLVGTVVKTLHLSPYEATSFAEAIKAGKYGESTAETLPHCAADEAGLAYAADVDLVQFDRDSRYDEMLTWGRVNRKQPIRPRHLLGIGSQHPDEQRKVPIVAIGSARFDYVLSLSGGFGWRRLDLHFTGHSFPQGCLFGFFRDGGYMPTMSPHKGENA